MKAIVCENPNDLKMIEMAKPTLKRGEALVAVKRIGICGTDIHAYKGNQPFFTYPRILGQELSGIIEDVEKNDSDLKKGDHVAVIPYRHCGKCVACTAGKTNCCTDLNVIGVHIDGGMCETLSVPVSHLIKIDGISLDEAAMLEPMSIGAHAVRRSFLKEGDNVLVIGAGPIGLGVMALAKYRGARVIAMDINEERLSFCQNWAKVDETVCVRNQPLQKIKDMTNGNLPNIVFDATGNIQSMNQSFQYAAYGGTIVFVGLAKGDIMFHDPDFHKKELTLMGSRNATKEDFQEVIKAVKSSSMILKDLITHRCSFNEIAKEFDHLLAPEAKVIKAVIEYE
ncbi:zinc-binding alcohol dehydrogenase family protein [Metabacillus halosaccharovorans]|uniref:Zinc-binding alcohol dehydrogenase family protein n=1 Tax=Metabacillus halosaccharovorans TaxID=930124 RepID=A0ABT3DNN9_9BACI|nr:zinc-binding alcohol dehydrogenase family protein [Metabacillus halosaccharovorans]MCV9888673.1 zinc-binding alcohol dehydrogenase family protein [Metabacillus halosaccharovorans]